MISIRSLLSTDIEAFTALRLEGIELFPDAFLLTSAEAMAVRPAQLVNWLESGDCFGLFIDGCLMGFAAIAQHRWTRTHHRASVGPFYTRPETHGKGGAQALIDHLCAAARARGIEQLELWVYSGNERATAFYLRNGFRQMGVMPRAVILDGNDQDDLLMVKALHT